MISDDNIVSVRSDIIFECCDCSISASITNYQISFTAFKISSKGYPVQESIDDRRKSYHNIVNFLNEHKKTLMSLIKRVEKKADEHDEKVYNIGV